MSAINKMKPRTEQSAKSKAKTRTRTNVTAEGSRKQILQQERLTNVIQSCSMQIPNSRSQNKLTDGLLETDMIFVKQKLAAAGFIGPNLKSIDVSSKYKSIEGKIAINKKIIPGSKVLALLIDESRCIYDPVQY